MAHEFETGFFTGQPAWHGLGVVLQEAPTMEDAIRCSGLDWNVKLEGLQITSDGRQVSHRATVRETDGAILGVVGPAFKPLQNVDALKWFQPFLDAGTVKLEAAGSLRGGARIWVLGKVVGVSADVVKGDRVDQHVLLSHGHDGSLAIRCGFTAVRVVCMNTLRAALDDKASSKLIKIRHTQGAEKALEKVREVMDTTRADFAATTEQLRELARAGCDEISLRRYVREVFMPGLADDVDAAKITVKKIVPLFESGRGSDIVGVRGTMWGAYNAVTEFLTHERGRTQDARLDSQWFGDGAMLASRALSVGLDFARAA